MSGGSNTNPNPNQNPPNDGPSGSSGIPSIEEKNKKIQREALMEKIRAKYRQKPRSYEELKKAIRMHFVEKHYPLDPLCKATLQNCLDKLQHYIKVTSRHGLVERLESLSRQLGLKFMEDASGLFISTDMFFLEIILDTSGKLTDVKVHHECKIEQQSCSELVSCLKRGDFADFTVQLEGLSSIYQLNAEPKVKKKAFVALQAMETDIFNLFQTQNLSGDTFEIMSKSSVGLVLPRRGGHPMKVTYFCTPIILPEMVTRPSLEFTVDYLLRNPYGLSATVNLEGSSANKLQIMPTITFSRDIQTNVEVPVYAPLTQTNSMLMPATYVLRLNKPLPVCYESLRALGLPLMGICDSNIASTSESAQKAPVVTSISNLIVQTLLNQPLKSFAKGGLYVCLPKETHCYHFTENSKLQATLITSLPFTEPSQVPKAIAFLKKQALFYTLLSSCVREQQTNKYYDIESTIILEITAVSFSQITVSLEHPYEESLATVDFILADGNVTCTIYSLYNTYELLSQKLTRVVRKVHSIPMVVYKLLKCWDDENLQKLHGSIGISGSSGGAGGIGNFASSFGGLSTAATGSSTSGSTGFGNFNMEMEGSGEAGGGSASADDNDGPGFVGMSNLKMEANLRSLADRFSASTSAAAAIAGLLNLKRETDPNAPTPSSSPSTSMHSKETPATMSMGQSNPPSSQQQQQQQQQNPGTSKASDIDLADKYKNIWKDKTPNLKHCVSITPITSEANKSTMQPQQSTSLDVTRTGGIEIIPLNAPISQQTCGSTNQPGTNTVTPATTSSTITITPIAPIAGSSGSAAKDKRSCGSTTSASVTPTTVTAGTATAKRAIDVAITTTSTSTVTSDLQKEKKRKKKRDDSPMGPPEKVYSRQNSPAASSDAGTTSVARKFSSPSSSPKGSSSGGLIASVATPGTSLSTRPSPKHSPVYSSPKHNTASNSPKSPFGTNSPKHGSSGKPSMSTLKSATATSLSPKGDKSSAASASGSGGGGGLVGSSSTAAMVRSYISGSGGNVAAGVSGGSTSAGMTATTGSTGLIMKSRDKDRSSTTSPPALSPVSSTANVPNIVSNTAVTAAAVIAASAAAAAALKSNLNVPTAIQQQQQQQLSKSVASLSQLAAAGNLSGFVSHASTGSSGTALDMNAAMRKGMAGGAVSLMTSTAVTAATSTISTASTSTASTTIIPITQIQHQQQPSGSVSSSEASASVDSDKDGGKSGRHTMSSSTASEYMVKPSQEGLKLTINKTTIIKSSSNPPKPKSSSSSTTSSSSTSSKKQHTGLKPGVNSGPASKKSSSSSSGRSSSSSSKHVFQKSSSSGNLSSKLTAGGSSGSSGASGSGLMKSNSTNTFAADLAAPRRRPSTGTIGPSGHKKPTSSTASSGASAASASTSQPPPRFDHHTDMMKILQYASPTMAASMEGFIKGLHTKFQIPKLSQRVAATATATAPATATTTATATSTATATATATATGAPTSTATATIAIATTTASATPHTMGSSSATVAKPLEDTHYSSSSTATGVTSTTTMAGTSSKPKILFSAEILRLGLPDRETTLALSANTEIFITTTSTQITTTTPIVTFTSTEPTQTIVDLATPTLTSSSIVLDEVQQPPTQQTQQPQEQKPGDSSETLPSDNVDEDLLATLAGE